MIARTLLAITLTLLGACGLFLSEQGQIDRALEAQRRGDLRAAAIDLKGLLEKHPQNSTARFHLGVITLAQGDAVAAVRELERAREAGYREPNLSEPLARAYLTLGQHDKAMQLVDARLGALENPQADNQADKQGDPTRVGLLRLRSELLAAQGRLGEAKSAFEKTLKIAPTDIATLLGFAQLVAMMDGPTAALVVSDRALAAAPKDAGVHRSRGTLFLAAGQLEPAIAAFQVATSAGGAKAELLLGLGGLAQAQIAAGKIKDAMATTERMQKLAPESAVTRYMRAYALVQDGQLDPARVLLEQNVVNEADLRSRVLLGAVNLSQGRLGQAEMYLASAVAGAPENKLARQLLAEARLRQAKPSDALETLAPALDGEAADSSLLALAARASIASGQTQRGVDYLRRNSKEHPDNLDAKLDLAAGYLAAGLPEKALAELNDANVDNAPSNQPSLKSPEKKGTDGILSEVQELRREYLAALARINKGDKAGAVAHAAQVADAQPQRASLQALASSLYAMQGQFAQARKYGDAVIRLAPQEAAGYVAVGRLDLLQNQPEKASESFKIALEKQPGNPTATTALAMIELAAQRPKAAIEIIDSALKHNPNYIDLRILKAQTLLSMGELESAEKLARETVALADTHATALALLGRVLTLREKHPEAIEIFGRAVRAAPDSSAVRQQLAVAHRAAGNREQALVTVKEVLRINANYLPAVSLAAQLNLAAGDLATAGQQVELLIKMAPEQSASHLLLGELRFAQKRFAEAAVAFHKAGALAPSGVFAVREYQSR
ncbi:MAG: tetratricopeptide repeat protein, partial [Candidatus Obscuribacterales bacterium]|nr:tetratricopeptide repeat protein [Steroidobacteraceae bacterium]